MFNEQFCETNMITKHNWIPHRKYPDIWKCDIIQTNMVIYTKYCLVVDLGFKGQIRSASTRTFMTCVQQKKWVDMKLNKSIDCPYLKKVNPIEIKKWYISLK